MQWPMMIILELHCLVVCLMDADFADNITLLSDTRNEAEALLNADENVAQSVRLVMNAGKTKFMCYEQDSLIQEPQESREKES